MDIYKSKTPLGKVKRGTVELKTPTNFSETSGCYVLKNISLEYSPKRKVLYLFPENNNGDHPFRWWSVEKEDIQNLIKELSKFL